MSDRLTYCPGQPGPELLQRQICVRIGQEPGHPSEIHPDGPQEGVPRRCKSPAHLQFPVDHGPLHLLDGGFHVRAQVLSGRRLPASEYKTANSASGIWRKVSW